jgi:hypothetical protein
VPERLADLETPELPELGPGQVRIGERIDLVREEEGKEESEDVQG